MHIYVIVFKYPKFSRLYTVLNNMAESCQQKFSCQSEHLPFAKFGILPFVKGHATLHNLQVIMTLKYTT